MATDELLPLFDTIAQCNRCGFCQAGCPVYRTTGSEHSVGRGRQAVARALILGDMELTPEVFQALEDCLLCRGCTAHCFPAIKTDRTVLAVRHAYIRRYGQPFWQRLLFKRILASSKRLETAGRMVLWARRHGLVKMVLKSGVLRLVDKRFQVSDQLLPPMEAKAFLRGDQDRVPRPDAVKHRIGYFASCGLSFEFPEVVAATLRVLARNGCAVTLMDNTCCGRPAHSYGDLDTARDIARKNLDRMAEEAQELEAVVSDCGSCSTHLKEYAELLQDDPSYREKAAAFSARIRSFSEFLISIGLEGTLGERPGSVTYHDPCHLSNRFARITAQPRKLLKSVPGLAYKELPEADWCCGAAGSYTFLHHEEASGVLERKMKNVAGTGAGTLVTECPACMMHLDYGARKHGLSIQVRHVSQVLDEAYQAARQTDRTGGALRSLVTTSAMLGTCIMLRWPPAPRATAMLSATARAPSWSMRESP
jgi:glycolate oxidase iron-sulfur subunit